MAEWKNWSGSLRFTPGYFARPENEAELIQLVKGGFSDGRKLRLAAAGHSSSPLVQTTDTLVNLDKMTSLVTFDRKACTATFEAGITVHEANTELQKHDLALFNTGDVDVQTLAGAISTGTHGSGKQLRNLADMLTGARLIDYRGKVHDLNDGNDKGVMRAMRVSLGALGIISQITVKAKPLFRLHRTEVFASTENCLRHFDELLSENRNMDFYWYPRRDDVKIRILNEPGHGTQSFPFKVDCVEEEEGFVGEILPRHRELKFDEMEYALPAESALACFQEVRKRIKEKHRKDVAWRVLVRSIAKDDNFLSPHFGRDSISISLHHNAGLPFKTFFDDIEPIFVAYNGRPHWAKIHTRKASQLRPLYPAWDEFLRVRKVFDPDGYFLNDHLREILFDNEVQ